jgi:ankyrin repeat protein
MNVKPLRVDAPLQDYEEQAAGLATADAHGDLARWYRFESWEALSRYAEAAKPPGSPVFRFESAVEAVIDGRVDDLAAWIREDPELPTARSTRMHRATLLHYVAANGVEQYRQKSPPNAVEVARLLLQHGAPVDALAHMYGERDTTLLLLVSSTPPSEAGVQIPLIEALLDSGAAIEGALMTALAFGHREAAEALARRGARTDNLAAAAGLGRVAEAERLLATADSAERHRALALAAQHGQPEIVRLLLDAGEDPNRYNPAGNHAHSTPLHQAAVAGHERVVRLLVERGARLDITDTVYHGTPLGWAEYAGQNAVRDYLKAHS